LRIKKSDGVNIQMITEAGIIGKIGMNSNGVGCTLNALKAHGVSYDKLPCHLALRTVMESSSREAAVLALEKAGVASACHILVGDATGGTGLECSSEDLVKLEMNSEGIVTHTNHYVLKHKDGVVEAPDWLPDTRFRLSRINQLLNGAKEEELNAELAARLLKDETEGDGAAICRSAKSVKDNLQTLFSIVMDLGNKKAKVAVGRPASSTEILVLESTNRKV
jgi:isopenicillin-N N-acyltransferase-like protein